MVVFRRAREVRVLASSPLRISISTSPKSVETGLAGEWEMTVVTEIQGSAHNTPMCQTLALGSCQAGEPTRTVNRESLERVVMADCGNLARFLVWGKAMLKV